jgi:proline iminopeptidase
MHYNRKNIYRHFDQQFYNFNFQPIPFIDKEVMDTKMDITRELKKLTIPALIVYGRQDDQGESTFTLQKESLRFSEMHVIEQCGHEIVDDQPVEFFRILKNYLHL